jgi:hypothetical protein
MKNGSKIDHGYIIPIGAGPEKGHFSALLDFQKRHVLGTL